MLPWETVSTCLFMPLRGRGLHSLLLPSILHDVTCEIFCVTLIVMSKFKKN